MVDTALVETQTYVCFGPCDLDDARRRYNFNSNGNKNQGGCYFVTGVCKETLTSSASQPQGYTDGTVAAPITAPVASPVAASSPVASPVAASSPVAAAPVASTPASSPVAAAPVAAAW